MSLISLLEAELAYGDRPLLDQAALTVESGERIGLIGRNGTGKSALIRILAGVGTLDDGTVKRRSGLRVAFVEQEPELPAAATLEASLLERAAATGAAWRDHDPWRREARLEECLHRFGLETGRSPEGASGGERKRAALALAFAQQPDLLLLDEPTNHLDVDGIERLQELVLRAPAAIVITHDRAFLDAIATRIVELDRGILRSYPGNFAAYEARKSDELAAERIARRRFDKFWAQEEVWIRKGVEARRTRNEGRVKRLERLRVERSERRERLGRLNLALDAGERSGKLVAELFDVSLRFGERAIVDSLSLRVQRGDRIGLIGANGAGKSTLIRILLGALSPDRGRVQLGTNVQVAYFDQLREQLDPEATVAATISPGSDWVEINGERKHVTSYLGDFLFPSTRAKSPVKMLSGGERNRLLLARLFARPANLLVLDEPTNDLDIESLELLEDTLVAYPGTLLLVSHDRRFLDNVVTQTLAAEGAGVWREYVGGYSDWLVQRRTRTEPAPAAQGAATGKGAAAGAATPPGSGRAATERPVSSPAARAPAAARLGYKEQRELDALPAEIEALETEHAARSARLQREYVASDALRVAEIAALLEGRFARWAELEARRVAVASSGGATPAGVTPAAGKR
jgi:ATP-binding cassette subfamily F protein uup